MNYEKIIQEYRDERSMELYGKPESQLMISEVMNLNKYIHDYENPIWKPIFIDGNATNYEVSNVGKVRNVNTGKELKQQINEFGYKRVGLLLAGKPFRSKTSKVHRLVALAFIPNPENKPEVNHITCIKTCNWIGNLEWVTSSENKIHAHLHGLYSKNTKYCEDALNSKHTNEDAKKVCELLEKGYTPKEISEILNININLPRSIKYFDRWKEISSHYDIPKSFEKRRDKITSRASYNESDINKICKLLSENYTNNDISKATGFSTSLISNIRTGKICSYISNNYNIPQSIDLSDPIVKHKDEIINMLMNGQNDYGKILEMINIPDTRKSRKYIALQKCKMNK